MIDHGRKMRARWRLAALVCLVVVLVPPGVLAAPAGALQQGGWWDVVPEDETPSPFYDSILYSEIGPRLREIQRASNRVQVDVIGQSAGGRDLYLVTLSDPEAMGRLGRYQAIRRTMLEDPEAAQEMIDQFGDFKVPFFVNASIHGTEYPGVDAAMRLIETLAFEDTAEVRAILDNVILLVNVVQNPDGRVLGTRANGNGFDVNRDFATQSQPETRATVRVVTEWNPMVLLDLHGFISPMLIEPCTPPHNPNFEYDLFIRWALAQAQAMEAELLTQTGLQAQIPYLDDASGWDDWAPSYTPMYAMFHGAYGHTLETPYQDERGVDAHYAAVWGALKFVAQNREEMVRDQIEIYRRGFLSLPQQPIPPELLPKWDQYQDLLIQEFPAAYVIPVGPSFQVSAHQPARLIEFLLFNDVQVERASGPFSLDGVEYPPGTYVVWMDQPKRGLANTLLEDGMDLSIIEGLDLYSPPAVWSHPLLWGVSRAVMEEPAAVDTYPIERADPPLGFVEGGAMGAYAYPPTSIAAIQATNDLLARGVGLFRAPAPFLSGGRPFEAGTYLLPAGEPDAASLAEELAGRWALEVRALDSLPASAVPMHRQRVAAYVNTAGRFQLDRFGFDYEVLSLQDLNRGPDLAEYDLFVNTGVHLDTTGLNKWGRQALADFIQGGGDYVGIGPNGARLAIQAGVLDVAYTSIPGNSIVRIDYDPADAAAAGFGAEGYAFLNSSLWFSDLGAGVEAPARVDDGDEFFVSGYWPGWQTSAAAGKPVVVQGAAGGQDVTLIGFDPIFRAHPEDLFRLVANAIYDGLD